MSPPSVSSPGSRCRRGCCWAKACSRCCLKRGASASGRRVRCSGCRRRVEMLISSPRRPAFQTRSNRMAAVCAGLELAVPANWSHRRTSAMTPLAGGSWVSSAHQCPSRQPQLPPLDQRATRTDMCGQPSFFDMSARAISRPNSMPFRASSESRLRCAAIQAPAPSPQRAHRRSSRSRAQTEPR